MYSTNVNVSGRSVRTRNKETQPGNPHDTEGKLPASRAHVDLRAQPSGLCVVLRVCTFVGVANTDTRDNETLVTRASLLASVANFPRCMYHCCTGSCVVCTLYCKPDQSQYMLHGGTVL